MNLHLGCGRIKLPDFINIDIRQTEAADLIENIAELPSFKNDSVSLIYASHVLEHFGRLEYLEVLKRWYEVLSEGGKLRLSVPDLKKVFYQYSKGMPLKDLWGFLYGGQSHEFNFHLVGFDFETLRDDLIEVGFKNVRIWDWRLISHSNYDDYSQAYLPHMDKENGELMSLNIEATK